MHLEGRKACVTSPGFPWRIQHSSSRCCQVVVPTPRLIKHGVNTELAISYQTKHRKVSKKMLMMIQCCVIISQLFLFNFYSISKMLVHSASIKLFLFNFCSLAPKNISAAQNRTPSPPRSGMPFSIAFASSWERFRLGISRDCTHLQQWSDYIIKKHICLGM